MKSRLFAAYYRCQGWITPGLQYSQAHYEQALGDVVDATCDWLDAGCGHQLLPEWRRAAEEALVARCRSIVGVDPHVPSLQAHRTVRRLAAGTLSDLPFRDASFSLVTANMVVEHLDRPEEQLREVWRVLRPGGRFLFHTPNARSYTTRLARAAPEVLKKRMARLLEGRAGEDVFPTHYRANTTERLGSLAAETGFRVRSIRHVASSAQFAVVLPIALLELLWIRMLMKPAYADLRQTLIVTFEKP